MRITFNQQFNINNIVKTQNALDRASKELSTGKKLLTPADNPSDFAKSLSISNGLMKYDSYLKNNEVLTNKLKYEETILKSVSSNLSNIKDIAIKLKSPLLSEKDYSNYAKELSDIKNQMLDMINKKDLDGNYPFSGSIPAVPFSKDNFGNLKYNGNQQIMSQQMGDDYYMEGNTTGFNLFENIKLKKLDGTTDNDNIFNKITELEEVLNTGDIDDINYAVEIFIDNVDLSSQNINVNLSNLGGKLKNLDQNKNFNNDMIVYNKKFLSDVEDVNVYEAISNVEKYKVLLEALYKTNQIVTSTNLFNYLK